MINDIYEKILLIDLKNSISYIYFHWFLEMILEKFLSANHWDEKFLIYNDIRFLLFVNRKKIDMNSSEKLENRLEIEVKMIEKELKMKIYENLWITQVKIYIYSHFTQISFSLLNSYQFPSYSLKINYSLPLRLATRG